MLAKAYYRTAIQDLDVRGMVRNRDPARAIMDGECFEFRRQLVYGTRFYGATVVSADRRVASPARGKERPGAGRKASENEPR